MTPVIEPCDDTEHSNHQEPLCLMNGKLVICVYLCDGFVWRLYLERSCAPALKFYLSMLVRGAHFDIYMR